jgi:ABC-type anion transport system duplicated permease subunit
MKFRRIRSQYSLEQRLVGILGYSVSIIGICLVAFTRVTSLVLLGIALTIVAFVVEFVYYLKRGRYERMVVRAQRFDNESQSVDR